MQSLGSHDVCFGKAEAGGCTTPPYNGTPSLIAACIPLACHELGELGMTLPHMERVPMYLVWLCEVTARGLGNLQLPAIGHA